MILRKAGLELISHLNKAGSCIKTIVLFMLLPLVITGPFVLTAHSLLRDYNIGLGVTFKALYGFLLYFIVYSNFKTKLKHNYHPQYTMYSNKRNDLFWSMMISYGFLFLLSWIVNIVGYTALSLSLDVKYSNAPKFFVSYFLAEPLFIAILILFTIYYDWKTSMKSPVFMILFISIPIISFILNIHFGDTSAIYGHNYRFDYFWLFVPLLNISSVYGVPALGGGIQYPIILFSNCLYIGIVYLSSIKLLRRKKAKYITIKAV